LGIDFFFGYKQAAKVEALDGKAVFKYHLVDVLF
jgi:hypothetical protein